MRFIFLSLICLSIFAACEKKEVVNHAIDEVNEIKAVSAVIDPLRIRAEEIASSMEDRLLVSQMLISGTDGSGSIPAHMVNLFTENPAGGVMLFRYNLNTANDEIRALLSQTKDLIREKSGIPPFIAVDHEGGTVNRFSGGTAALPDASSYWDIYQKEGRSEALSKVETDSYKAGSEIAYLGINMNLAPVAEYLNDDNREFLLYRSYGPDPFFTFQAASSYVQSMAKAGILCVIKHFPGSAGPDPHFSSSAINVERKDLDSLIFPFIMLIYHGARAVMVAHTYIPSVDSNISSLSSAFMQTLLREEIGFDGIIICDDFSMAAAGNMSQYEAAVQSIAAGADMILVWPPDLRKTHAAIMSALEDGRLPRERITDAVQRIIYEKLRMGLFE